MVSSGRRNRSPTSSTAVTPTPRANNIDGQLRIAFRQVSRNSCMGLEQAAFVGSHFGVDPLTMRRLFKELGGATLTEDQFVGVVQKAIIQSRGITDDWRWMASLKVQEISRNEAMLHKTLSALPTRPAAPPTQAGPGSPISPFKKAVGDAEKRPPKAGSRPGTSQRPGTSSLMNGSRPGTSQSRRSTSAPPGALLGDEGSKRPGTASYMAPYTPGGHYQLSTAAAPWRWSRIDNNVPKHIRNVLLKPMRPPSRADTPKLEDAKPSSLLEEVRHKMRAVNRMDAVVTFEGVLSEQPKNGLMSVANVRNGMQVLGVNLAVDKIMELAHEVHAVSEEASGDESLIKYRGFINGLIPTSQVLVCEEAGIQTEKFAKFKQQRMRITSFLSSKEIKLLELLREKLKSTQTGAADLRKSFRLLDSKSTGRANLKTLTQALSLRGVGMSPEDSEVLYMILDPEGKEGLDYNMFTALMFPPKPEDAEKDTVYIAKELRQSRSRQLLREKCQPISLVEEKALSPADVPKFLKSLNADQILQILRNKVALAMKAGPGALRRWFQLFDADGDNVIDHSELKDALVDFGLNLSDQQVSAVMAKVDHDMDGNVDQTEFVLALLPKDHYSLSSNESELKDPEAVGVTTSGGKLAGDDLRMFLKDKLVREFVKKGDKSPGYQIREALSRFDANHDGRMSVYEMRKAFNSLGLTINDETIKTLIALYDKIGSGTADLVAFVEDIDPSAFSYAFSVGSVAQAGTFDTVEKEDKIEVGDSDELVIKRLREALHKRMKKDGTKSVLKEIRPYSTAEGKISRDEFKAALMRLGLKIHTKSNLDRCYDAFKVRGTKEDALDIYSFASQVESDLGRPLTSGMARQAIRKPVSHQVILDDPVTPPKGSDARPREPMARVPSAQNAEGSRPQTASIVQPRPFG